MPIDAGAGTPSHRRTPAVRPPEAPPRFGQPSSEARPPSPPRDSIDSAITSVNSPRGRLGATRNGLAAQRELGRESAESQARPTEVAVATAERASDWIIRNMMAALRSHRGVVGDRALQLLHP